ncbi:MAG: hypothetical protein Q9219_003460 [cf. Caloplaca sp. 3 TL-2023]
MLSSLLLLLPLFWDIASVQAATTSSTGPTPTCFQPRAPADPVPSAISSVLASALPDACNPELEEVTTLNRKKLRTFQVDSFNLNISQNANPTSTSDAAVPSASCQNAFQNIITTCVESPVGVGFWGGWVVVKGLNYSISDFVYPKNALLSASSQANAPTQSKNGPVKTATGKTGSGKATKSQGTSLDNPGSSAGTAGSAGPSGSLEGTRTRDPTGTRKGTGAQNPTGSGGGTRNPTGTGGGIRDPTGTGGGTRDPAGTGTGKGTLDPAGTVGGTRDPNGTGGGTRDPTGTGGGIQDPTGTGGGIQNPTGTGGGFGTLDPTGTAGGTRDPTGTEGGTRDLTGTGGGTQDLTGTGAGTRNPVGTGSGTGTLGPTGTGKGPSGGSGGTAESGTQSGGSGLLATSGLGNTNTGGTGSGGASTGGNANPTGSIKTSAGQSQGGTQGGTGNPTGPVQSSGGQAPGNSQGGPGTGENTNPPATQPGGNTDNPGGNTITEPPSIPTTPIEPDSPAATSDGYIIGGLLAGLSKSAAGYSNDITIPATKTAFLQDIEDTEGQLETLFTNMGGKLPPDTGGCSGGARKRRRGLGDLVGDVFNTVRCAINSVNTLKGHIDVPKPDFPTINGDLKDIGSLSENIDDNKENDEEDEDDDDDDDSSTDDQDSTKEPSTKEEASTKEESTKQSTQPSSNEASTTGPSSTVMSSSFVSSTRASSSDPCLGGPVTTGAGGLVKRATDDSCNYECPTPVPAAPTEGPLAITPGPTEPADSEMKHRRAIAGRVHVKRKAKEPVVTINGCQLLTPSNPPDPVTTPDYPGGYKFWQSDSNGQLPQSLQAISRYYRTTDGPNQQCAPIVTKVPANALTPKQNDENEIVSVDHAYENGWLQGFFESIINGPSQPTLDCAGANAIFFNVYPGAPCAANRMAPIYNALASYDSPDFVVMSQWLNGQAKGWIMGPDFDPNLGDFFDGQWVVGGPGGLNRWNGQNQARDSIQFKLGTLKNILLGSYMIQADNVIPLIQKTNNRVYKAFQSLDQSLQGSIYATSDFSGKYKDYMNNRAQIFNQAPGLVTRMIANIQSDLQAATSLPDVNSGERGSFAFLLASYKATYTIGNNAQDWQFQVNLEWDTNNVRRDLDDEPSDAALFKFRNLLYPRQESAADSCPLTAGPSASLPAASGFATGAVTAGGDGGGTTQTGGDGDDNDTKTNAEPTKTNAGPTSTKPPSSTATTQAPQSCQADDDCADYKCTEGDAFCAIAISKGKRQLLFRRQDEKPTPTTAGAADASFPTGFCACETPDPTSDEPSKTTAPPPAGCTAGTYDNFDDCSDHCDQGYCQENAGQPQITCACN